MKHILGMFVFSAWDHTFWVWDSTPLTPSIIVTTPSRTCRLRVTSPEKSTCPGVSIRFIWWLFQLKLMAADRIVIPLYLSWVIKSIVVVPSSISEYSWEFYCLERGEPLHSKAFFPCLWFFPHRYERWSQCFVSSLDHLESSWLESWLQVLLLVGFPFPALSFLEYYYILLQVSILSTS